MALAQKKSVLVYILLFVVLLVVVLLSLSFVLQTPLRKTQLPRRFGATYMTMDNHYFEILNTAIEEIIESNGDYLVTRDPAQSQEKQNRQIIDMLDMGVDLIFINPVDSDTVTPALQECARRQVPVITVDTDVNHGEYTLCQIVSDNYGAGVLIGKDVARRCKKANLVILYDKKINSTEKRFQGFLDAISQSDLDYTIVHTADGVTLLQETMIAMQRFLELNLPFDVVFAANDPTSLGALAAIQKNHLKEHILVYGIDGSPSGKTMVQQGYMVGTAAQFPRIIGKRAVECAYDYFDGKPIEHDIIIPVELITKENLDDFDILGWQ